MVKQKLLTFQSKSVSHTHAPMSPFIFVSAKVSLTAWLTMATAALQGWGFGPVIVKLQFHVADGALWYISSVSVSVNILSVKSVD